MDLVQSPDDLYWSSPIHYLDPIPIKTHEVCNIETPDFNTEDVWKDVDQRMFPILEPKKPDFTTLDQGSLSPEEVKAL